MAELVLVDEDGTLHLPRELFGDTPLPAHYIVESRGGVLTLRKYDVIFNRELIYDEPDWFDRTPEQRAAAIHAWVASHTDGPGLPDEAIRRENLYD